MLLQVYRERRRVAEGSVDLDEGAAFGEGDGEVDEVGVGVGEGFVGGGVAGSVGGMCFSGGIQSGN